MDGVGEWATTTWGQGHHNQLELLGEQRFPHSLGLLYSALTYFCGFKVNSGEYKLMGLAPYGEPRYVQTMLDHLLDLKPDGSFRLALDYFGFVDGLTMTNQRFATLFGGPPRRPESPLTRRELDLARSVQWLTEEIVLRTARHVQQQTGQKQLCMAGGVALNCVANGRLLREGPFDDLWIQPAAGDAGGALGAAYAVWHEVLGKPRSADGVRDQMQGALLGPAFDNAEIEAFLTARGYPFRALTDDAWAPTLASLLANGAVVGVVQGRMEFGPRALGNRSILGDARSPTMQSVMNQKIKQRESFRPFAPAVLQSAVSDYFALDRPSPYMLLVAPVHPGRCHPVALPPDADLQTVLHQQRSELPAITHVDYSARVQTVDPAVNPQFASLLQAFAEQTGTPVLINTSFNVRGEPIVCTPEDGYRCFRRTDMDYLVLGNCLLAQADQPPLTEPDDWQKVHPLD